MKPDFKRIAFIFTLLALAAGAFAQTPLEQLQQLAAQLQAAPSDSLREQIIKLAASISPAPAIPEEARRNFAIGERLFKGATDFKQYYNASNAYWDAIESAPWWSDAYWNYSIVNQALGRYRTAKWGIRQYLRTNPREEDVRLALDRIYSIEADSIITTTGAPIGLIGFWVESRKYNVDNTSIYVDPENARNEVFEILKEGSAYVVRSLNGISCKINLLFSDVDKIKFQLMNCWDDEAPIYDGKLIGRELCFNVTGSKRYSMKFFSKRKICEIVGGPGISGYFVLCK